MNIPAAVTLATTLWATLALAQTRQITLVKNSPTNYGTNGFDISWVDNSTQKYYLADRTNDAIDVVNAATDFPLGSSGKASTRAPDPAPAVQGICATAPGRTEL